jgi:NitT/TauT family transport system ATP-binding protein
VRPATNGLLLEAVDTTPAPSMTSQASPKVCIDGVCKAFDTREGSFVALEGINLDIYDNQFVALVGPSGCGKSTLLEIIAGLQAPTSGVVTLNGRAVVRPGPDRALVFQHYALFPWRSVLRNVAFPLEMAGVPRRERHDTARRYLAMVGLEAFASKHIWQLSGGMQQRVALARAMACAPDVMLMDEPFSGADAITRELLQAQLAELHRATQKTTVFVTHSVDEAIRLSDRIVVMGTRPGKIVREFVIHDDDKSDAERFAALRTEIWNLLRAEIIPDGSAPVGGA